MESLLENDMDSASSIYYQQFIDSSTSLENFRFAPFELDVVKTIEFEGSDYSGPMSEMTPTPTDDEYKSGAEHLSGSESSSSTPRRSQRIRSMPARSAKVNNDSDQSHRKYSKKKSLELSIHTKLKREGNVNRLTLRLVNYF